jgi:hypothetical protein
LEIIAGISSIGAIILAILKSITDLGIEGIIASEGSCAIDKPPAAEM